MSDEAFEKETVTQNKEIFLIPGTLNLSLFIMFQIAFKKKLEKKKLFNAKLITL